MRMCKVFPSRQAHVSTGTYESFDVTEASFSWYTGKLIQSDCGWLYQFGTATYTLADVAVCQLRVATGISVWESGIRQLPRLVVGGCSGKVAGAAAWSDPLTRL